MRATFFQLCRIGSYLFSAIFPFLIGYWSKAHFVILDERLLLVLRESPYLSFSFPVWGIKVIASVLLVTSLLLIETHKQCLIYLRKILIGALFIGVLSFAFWIRIYNVDQIPDGQFTGFDPYLYRWQALTISEQGHLPARDMYRWLPTGRDNGQLLPLFSYAIAYTHKAVSWLFPELTLYNIQLFAPAVCFTIGLGVLLIFLTRFYDPVFAFIIGVLLATLPGSILRSAAGFGDRDAWCWLIGVLSVTTYLWKEQMPLGKCRYLTTALCGFIVFLGGMSWEAFGIFVLILSVTELWKFWTTDTEQYLKEYLIWISMFIPVLYLITPAYRSGYGFCQHIDVLTLAPPLVILKMRGIRYLLLTYFSSLCKNARIISLGLTLLALVIGLSYLLLQSHTFELTAFALRESRLMQTIGELADPDFLYWKTMFGPVFTFGGIGLILGSRTLGTRMSFVVYIPLIIFFQTTFFREFADAWIGEVWCNWFFFGSLGLTFLSLGLLALRHATEKPDKNELVMFSAISWFLIWGSFARTGKRYDLFIAPVLAYGTAWCVYRYPSLIIQNLSQKMIGTFLRISQRWITVVVAIIVLFSIFYCVPLFTTTKYRTSVPGRSNSVKAYQWIKKNTHNAVIGSLWEHGVLLNVFGGAKNIIDTDHFFPHWVHLYCRHVFCAQTEAEALSFLKTHGATHLLITKREVTDRASEFSYIGSHENDDRLFHYYQLEYDENNSTEDIVRMTLQGTPLSFIDVTRLTPEKYRVKAQFRNNVSIQRDLVFQAENPPLKAVDLGNGGVLLSFNSRKRLTNAQYFPSVGWNSLAVKLYFREAHSSAFVPVYPTPENRNADVKIWEINYPIDIKVDKRYLATKPKE